VARISGVNIDIKKNLWAALSAKRGKGIFGIGPFLAKKICAAAKINENTKVKDLTESDLEILRKIIEDYKVEGTLRREISVNIKKKKDIQCYEGLRHIRNLPVRGQRTHSNARTRKGKAVAIAGKKKVTK
jgi:small subunit ribosomal protein S13